MTQVQTQEIKEQEVKTTTLNDVETKEIEKVFSEAKDFRSVWEKITSPLDSIISQTAAVIDNDPIMNVSDELQKMNWDVQSVYKDILDTDSTIMKLMKSIPWLWSIAEKIWSKVDEAKFNMKTVEWKINVIFSWFDVSYNSINTSIDMQKNFLDGIDANLDKVKAYEQYVNQKLEELKAKHTSLEEWDEKFKIWLFIQNVEFFKTNLTVLIWNLEMAKKRLLMRLDSAQKLSLAMNSSRPIFKTLLSTALIETSSQKALDASMKAMDVMWKTIDKMSSELTDKAIESSKKAEEMASKPVVSTKVFIDNVTKLKNHFDTIDSFREKVKQDAIAERKEFENAKVKLENMKVLDKKGSEELEEVINGW